MKLNIKLIDKVVGLFILLAIIGLVSILVILGLNQRWFKKNYYFNTKFASAGNISNGMAITLSGFQIGKVDKIILEPDNKWVQVDFYIFEEYYEQAVLPNSIIELVASPIGLGSGLVFHPGKIIDDRREPIPEGSLIYSFDMEEGKKLVRDKKVVRAGSGDTIGALLGQVGTVIEQVSGILTTTDDLLDDIDRSISGTTELQLGTLLIEVTDALRSADLVIRNVNNILSGKDEGPIGNTLNNVSEVSDTLDYSINREMAKVDAILADVKGITSNLETLTADPTGLVVRLIDPKGSIETFLNDDNRLFNEVEEMLADVGSIIAELEKFATFITSTTPQISGILEEGKETLNQGQDVLEGLKNNPLLKGGITEQRVQPSTYAGGRDEEF